MMKLLITANNIGSINAILKLCNQETGPRKPFGLSNDKSAEMVPLPWKV